MLLLGIAVIILSVGVSSLSEMKDIFYAYEKGRPILSNINTVFESGKMYAILGPSGLGKTTLLSLIGGLDVPQKGEILFDGENIAQRGLAEPTGNLDEGTAGEITGILKESAHELNKCVIVVTHSNELAAQADVVLRLKRGSLHRGMPEKGAGALKSGSGELEYTSDLRMIS